MGYFRKRPRSVDELNAMLTGALTPSSRAKPVAHEHYEQVALIDWARLKGAPYDRLFAIANGGVRHPGIAGQLKAEGVRAGVPDLCLPLYRAPWSSLYIEMKRRDGGALSPEQCDWLSWLAAQRNYVACCHGWDEAATVIELYINDTDSLPAIDARFVNRN